ncbi:MAG: WYL domain-containing protein [Oscillospiraceae bacterium]|nr:WYL domain-containing protein [Oscillospiraceae bacterium]
MPKSANQKLKLLYLARLLYERSDEAHPLSVADMIASLAGQGVAAERKSVYDDLEALRVFGLDVVAVRGRTAGYYLASRTFELPELKLLVDTVQSSKFVTERKTLALIKKIESLASVYEAGDLSRQVLVRDRVKSMNESVYYNVDALSNAILRDRTVRFRYFDYAVSGERRLRRGGAEYEISPLALLCEDENYYLLGFDAEAALVKHFRVDKMLNIAATDRPRQGVSSLSADDVSSYAKRVFGMFGGETRTVRLRFAEHLAGAVFDRFGRDAHLIPDGEGFFTVTTEAVISPHFFAWLFGFGTEAELLAPADVRAQMLERLSAAAAAYRP